MLNFGVTFLITIGNFIILFFILRKVLFKPVKKFLDARAKRIADSLANAAALTKQAEDVSKRYDLLMQEADAEAEKVLKEAKEKAWQESKTLLEKSKAEAAENRRVKELALQNELEVARATLIKDMARLATDVAAKLLSQNAESINANAALAITQDLESSNGR